ncbi:MAG: hypothetical protein ACREFX_04380 [Opitutaceae bacterium]
MARPASIAVVVVLAGLCAIAAWQEIQVGRLREELVRQTDALADSGERIATLSGQLALAKKAESALSARLTNVGAAGAADAGFRALLADFDQTCADARDAASEHGFSDGSSGMDLAIAEATSGMMRRLAGYVGAPAAERMLQTALVDDWARSPAAIPATPPFAEAPRAVAAAMPPQESISVIVPAALAPGAQEVALATQEAAAQAAAQSAPPESPSDIAAYAVPFYSVGPVAAAARQHRRDYRAQGRGARNSLAAVRDFAASAGIPVNIPGARRAGAASY